jgi:hypothetical protein
MGSRAEQIERESADEDRIRALTGDGKEEWRGAHFHIHTIAAALDGRLLLLQPERIDLAGLS